MTRHRAATRSASDNGHHEPKPCVSRVVLVFVIKWASLLLAFLAHFLLDFSLRLFYAESDLLYLLANLFRDAGYRAPTIVDLFSLNADPAVLAMCEQVHEQLDVSWDTFRYNYFAHWAKGKN